MIIIIEFSLFLFLESSIMANIIKNTHHIRSAKNIQIIKISLSEVWNNILIIPNSLRIFLSSLFSKKIHY